MVALANLANQLDPPSIDQRRRGTDVDRDNSDRRTSSHTENILKYSIIVLVKKMKNYLGTIINFSDWYIINK